MYYHAAGAEAIVTPKCTKVLLVAPEIISNSDGEEKQNCELKAGKRWLSAHGDEYKWLKLTVLGNDLYAHRPFCEKIIDEEYQSMYSTLTVRVAFFEALRVLIRRRYSK